MNTVQNLRNMQIKTKQWDLAMEIQNNNNNKNNTIYDEGKGNINSLNNSHRTKSSGNPRRNVIHL